MLLVPPRCREAAGKYNVVGRGDGDDDADGMDDDNDDDDDDDDHDDDYAEGLRQHSAATLETATATERRSSQPVRAPTMQLCIGP